MKLVIAIIQPTKLNAVQEALQKIDVERMTVCDSQGFARQPTRSEMYHGREAETSVVRKITLEVMVNDDFLERTVQVIATSARSGPEGSLGDGNVFVLPADQAVKIDDGSRGPGAV